MKKLSLIILLLLFHFTFTDSVYAQKGFMEIRGKVVDAETGLPIEFATVYISNTTLGTLTNKDGAFTIKNCPVGTYKILCSAIGYAISSKKVIIISEENIWIDFQVKVNPIKVNEITVTGQDPAAWKNSLRKFKREFIGNSKASFECELVNPEVLDFTTEKKNLIATSSSPLILINRWLGYKLTVMLKEFSFNKNFSEGKYAIEPFFEELKSEDSTEIKHWNENRLKAYLGSFRHFLKSCANRNLFEEGFAVTLTDTSTSGNILDVESKMIRSAKFKTNPAMFGQTRRMVDSAIAKILFKKNDSEFVLSYPDFIKVRYFNESEEFNYKWYKEQMFYSTKLDDSQVTWLKFPKEKYSFNKNGIGIEGEYFQKQFLGYWAWKRVGDLLPDDYELPKDDE